jgi:hypothetical protein
MANEAQHCVLEIACSLMTSWSYLGARVRFKHALSDCPLSLMVNL